VAALKKPSWRNTWKTRHTELEAQLKSKVFGWFPTEKIPFETKVSKSTGGWHVRYGYADYKECSFQTEPGVRVRAQLHTPKQGATNTPLLIYIKRAVDSFYGSDVDELLPLMSRYTVLILNPRWTELAMGPAEYADVERTAVWSGRTIAAMQIWDVLRAVEWAMNEEKLPVSSVSLYGKGDMGVVALYAAFFEQRIQRIVLNEPPASHWQSPALLNVLRVTDIAEVAGALAPRRLIWLTKPAESFEHTRAIYRVQGGVEQFLRAASLPEALEVARR
jgi:hypothetical protein